MEVYKKSNLKIVILNISIIVSDAVWEILPLHMHFGLKIVKIPFHPSTIKSQNTIVDLL